MGENLTEYEALAFLNLYSKTGDGRVHKMHMWLQQSNEWDKQREFLIKEAVKKAKFDPVWFVYDADRDWQVSLEDLEYVRAAIETADETY